MFDKILISAVVMLLVNCAVFAGLYYSEHTNFLEAQHKVTQLKSANEQYERAVSDLQLASDQLQKRISDQNASIRSLQESEARANAAALEARAKAVAVQNSNTVFKNAISVVTDFGNTGCEAVPEIAGAFIDYANGSK